MSIIDDTQQSETANVLVRREATGEVVHRGGKERPSPQEAPATPERSAEFRGILKVMELIAQLAEDPDLSEGEVLAQLQILLHPALAEWGRAERALYHARKLLAKRRG